MAQLLSQAQQGGATLVVGPLLKNHVEALLSSNTMLNVLALNLPENPVRRNKVCYFALSPEDEARNSVRHIREQGRGSRPSAVACACERQRWRLHPQRTKWWSEPASALRVDR